MALTDAQLDALHARGVIVHAPAATVVEGVPADHFEPGVELFPGVVIRGERSRFGRGTKLGRAGGGYFEDVCTGRDVDLYGGFYQDCVLLDGVTIRGQAEVRGGTLLEEGCEAAHHVGYKMTVMLPWVVAGSLVNACDVFVSGGTSRRDHSEIGSALAVYNFTPWGDKWGSLLGDVAHGVLLRQRPIFVGGQTQIVSPVSVGFGAVLAAGSAVRRDVGPNRLYGEAGVAVDRAFDPAELGAVLPRLHTTARLVGNLALLRSWYRLVRLPCVAGDAHLEHVYTAAVRQLSAGVDERARRLRSFMARVPSSLERHVAQLEARSTDLTFEQRHRRIEDHRRALALWPRVDALLDGALRGDDPAPAGDDLAYLQSLVTAYRAEPGDPSAPGRFVAWIRDGLSDRTAAAASAILARALERWLAPILAGPSASAP